MSQDPEPKNTRDDRFEPRSKIFTKKTIAIWIGILILPVPSFILMLGWAWLGGSVIALLIWLSYWRPLWFLGESFFDRSKDLWWYYPNYLGLITTAIVYSIVYWIVVFTIVKIKDHFRDQS